MAVFIKILKNGFISNVNMSFIVMLLFTFRHGIHIKENVSVCVRFIQGISNLCWVKISAGTKSQENMRREGGRYNAPPH
jgi:hypothetical protein